MNGIDYSVNGNYNGKGIVFLPGLGLEDRHYTLLINSLGKNYQVFTPNLYNFNSKSVPETPQDYAEVVDGLQRKIKFENEITVGHSLGGLIGFIMAQNDCSIQKLIGLNPMVNAPTEIHDGKRTTFDFQKGLLKCFIHELTGYSGPGSFSFTLKNTIPYMLKIFNGNMGKALKLEEGAIKFYSQTGVVSTPTFILHSENDEFSNYDKWILNMTRPFKHSLVGKVPASTHNWPIFFGDSAAEVISDFLNV